MTFRRGFKKKKATKPPYVLVVGHIYLVRGYHTGDFRAKCCDSLLKTVRLKVTDPMKAALQVDDEIEIPFVHAEFIPALVQDVQKVIEQRAAGGSR